MESSRQDYSAYYSSDQEVDQSEQGNKFGVGRSYECVFCRRGFNTAQALGGHMNIHRKDRPRNKSSTINTNKHEQDHTGPRFYQQSSSSHLVEPHEAVQTECRTYFPASTSSARPFYTNHHSIYDHSQQRFNPFGDDKRMSLSLPFGPGLVEEEIGKSRRGGVQEEELDLELRLGP